MAATKRAVSIFVVAMLAIHLVIDDGVHQACINESGSNSSQWSNRFVLCLATTGDRAAAFIPTRFGARILGAVLGAIGLHDLLFQKANRGVVVFNIGSRQAVQLLVLLDVELKALLLVTRPLLAHDALFLPAILVDALAVVAQVRSDPGQSLASRLLAKRTIQQNRVQQIAAIQRRRQLGKPLAARSRLAALRLAGESAQRIIVPRLLFQSARRIAAASLRRGGSRRRRNSSSATCAGERTTSQKAIEPTSRHWRHV